VRPNVVTEKAIEVLEIARNFVFVACSEVAQTDVVQQANGLRVSTFIRREATIANRLQRLSSELRALPDDLTCMRWESGLEQRRLLTSIVQTSDLAHDLNQDWCRPFRVVKQGGSNELPP